MMTQQVSSIEQKWRILSWVCCLSAVLMCSFRCSMFDSTGGNNDDNLPPLEVHFRNVPDDSVFADDSACILWHGNEESAEFRYQVDGGQWNDWGNLNLSYRQGGLSDGSHVLVVQTRFPEGAEVAADSLVFFIDAPVAPELHFENVPRDSVFLEDSACIFWSAGDESAEFRYQLDGDEWNDWDALNLSYRQGGLANGIHVLVVETRFAEGAEVATDSVVFFVDALLTPAVFLAPRKMALAGDTVDLTIETVGIPACHLIHLVINGARITEAELLHGTSGQGVNLLWNDSTVDVAVLGGLAISGDSRVADVTVTGFAPGSRVTVEIVECVVRDSTNSVIPLEMTRGTTLIRE